MKKTILYFIILICSTTLFADNQDNSFIKKIEVTGTSEKILTPDLATIEFVISTSDKSSEKAGNENAQLLDKFKSLLKTANISIDKIDSTNYNSYKSKLRNEVIKNEGKKEFYTDLQIELQIDNLSNLRNIITILSDNGVNKFNSTNHSNKYIFTVIEHADTSDASYNLVLNKYKTIENKLASLGISRSKMTIYSYKTRENSLETTEFKEEEFTNIEHSFVVHTKEVNKLGILLNIANSIGINTRSIKYDFENKKLLEDQLYGEAYLEANKKADVMLAKTNLKLFKPVTIYDNSRSIISPYYDYSYSTNYNYDTKSVSKTDKLIIEEAINYNKKFNIKKVNVSKSVNIEFEMIKK